jgi:hypothetical protein
VLQVPPTGTPVSGLHVYGRARHEASLGRAPRTPEGRTRAGSKDFTCVGLGGDLNRRTADHGELSRSHGRAKSARAAPKSRSGLAMRT